MTYLEEMEKAVGEAESWAKRAEDECTVDVAVYIARVAWADALMRLAHAILTNAKNGKLCCNPECGGDWGTGCYHCHRTTHVCGRQNKVEVYETSMTENMIEAAGLK